MSTVTLIMLLTSRRSMETREDFRHASTETLVLQRQSFVIVEQSRDVTHGQVVHLGVEELIVRKRELARDVQRGERGRALGLDVLRRAPRNVRGRGGF